MSASGKKDRSGLLEYTVGVGMQRPVVDERHETRRRYPNSLMPLRRIRMTEFSIDLGYQRTFEPKAAAAGRRLFEEVLHAVEKVIADFDPDAVLDPQLSHGSPSIGAGDVPPSAFSDPIVGEAPGAPAPQADAAPGAPSEDDPR